MPVIQTQGGLALAGAIGAEALLGGPPQTLAEVCLFAAAAGFPLRQLRETATEIQRLAAQQREARARQRAQACATRLAAEGKERAAALEAIAAWRMPTDHAIPPLSRAVAMVVEDVQRFLPAPSPSLELTLDLAAQARAERAVAAALDDLAPRLAPGLCLTAGCETPGWTVAVAEIVGDALPLRVAAVNRHGALFGPVAQGPAGIERRAPAFGLASQHKAPLALVAAAHSEERLCDRAAGGIRNAAGSSPVTACEPGRAAGWVAADVAMGRSLNLPWIDLVARH
jgi:hypothetical protein